MALFVHSDPIGKEPCMAGCCACPDCCSPLTAKRCLDQVTHRPFEASLHRALNSGKSCSSWPFFYGKIARSVPTPLSDGDETHFDSSWPCMKNCARLLALWSPLCSNSYAFRPSYHLHPPAHLRVILLIPFSFRWSWPAGRVSSLASKSAQKLGSGSLEAEIQEQLQRSPTANAHPPTSEKRPTCWYSHR